MKSQEPRTESQEPRTESRELRGKILPAKSMGDLLKQNFKTFDFAGDYLESFGKPEMNGAWILWGESGNGKTDLALKLAKYFSTFGKVFYNTLEERGRESFKLACIRNNMQACGSRFSFGVDDYETLRLRLRKKRSAKIVVVDSIQYFKITVSQYKELLLEFPNVLFIFVSHAKGALPKGAVADEIRYDADVKIQVAGFLANIQSRFGGNKPFIIWEEGYRNQTLKLT